MRWSSGWRVVLLSAAVAALVPAAASSAPVEPATHPVFRPTTDQSPSATSPEVEALVDQLSGESAAERQRAMERLIDLAATRGDVEARLKRVLRESRDDEAVARAGSALDSIGENRLSGATRVTLRLHDVDPSEAFARLQEHSGYPMTPEPANLWSKKKRPAVSLDAAGMPFWEVMLDLCRRTGIEPDFGDNGRFKYVESLDGKWGRSPSRVVGPVLLQAARVTRTRSVEFADPVNAEQTCQLTINGYLEPKLRLMSKSLPVAFDSAVDENGHSLLPDDEADPPFSPVGENTRAWEGELNLALPANVGRRIASLKGSLFLHIPTRVETLNVPHVLAANNLGRTVAGRRMIVNKAVKVRGGYQVQVTLFRDHLDDESWLAWLNPRDFVRLTDAERRPILFIGIADTQEAEEQATLTLVFENPNNQPAGIAGPVGTPTNLEWEVPVESREVKLPFEFRDLPLP